MMNDSRQRLRTVVGNLIAMFAGACIMAWIHSTPHVIPRNLEVWGDLDISMKLIRQRNLISEMLNRQQQKLGALQCEMKTRVNERGAYCREVALEQRNMLDDAHVFYDTVQKISMHFKGKTAASFGEGVGVYTKLMIESGYLTKVDSYDGNPFCNETSGGKVQFLDLSVPQYWLPVYDVIVSIEVAEHIPKQFEHTYLDNIARHAREAVLISWATPGQEGVEHVNCRPFSYVKDRMKELGFKHDVKNSIKIRSGAVSILSKNLNLFIRESPDQAIDIYR